MTPPAHPRIMIVEDDKAMRLSLIDLLEAADWQVEALPRAARVAERLAEFQPDVILSDVRMPGLSGLDLLASLDPELSPPLVLISAHGDIAMAVEAMQGGAYSFVEKPYEPRRLLTILQHALEQHRMKRTTQRLKERLVKLSGLDRVLLGQTPETVALREEVLDLAQSGAAVLLQGETGTGKELVARALHDLGPNAEGPFLALNCAALSPEGFEAEMFGVHDGAKGRLPGVDGGTVFLDEVCSCPPAVQAKLLRVIEDKEVLPLGAARPVPLSFRVISATNEDPDEAVATGRLRQDLLYRLNTTVIKPPTLRQRRDDVMLLAARFLDEFARVYETRAPDLTPEDTAALLAHDWPGNVRELRNVCERRVLAARRGAGSMAQALHTDALGDDVPDTLREAVAAFERELIGKAITAHQGRMEAVAEALGIGRRTLNEKIVKLGLDKEALL
ncbi:two-component system, NtrC family, C4-dicarboxylate transport response regulator DctD [Roseovarius marisflavi]|uniref:Two-component system, NtrC family, C4-dicarboxylate transport response regulator DctD n=1 Tax=Roseovarius marisflavi TaxID=1054996 RepID=A0A1M6Z759_9RHOB|nr:sigma-54 dependent transcriptional regulator [Roseovarius marisflavi]SHL26245.1 two-component system, NtrC family, C4-dicarboxylate transport response regulator DctD [Roseovarius marisflavi]